MALNQQRRRLRFKYFVWRAYGRKCLCCLRRIPFKEVTADHVVSKAEGGKNHWQNMQPLCFPCNLKKGGRTIDYRPYFFHTLSCLRLGRGHQPNKYYFRREKK